MSSSKKSGTPRRPRRPHTTEKRTDTRRETREAFRDLVRQNPRAASAVLEALEIVANSNRRRAMLLVEAVSTIVAHIRGQS